MVTLRNRVRYYHQISQRFLWPLLHRGCALGCPGKEAIKRVSVCLTADCHGKEFCKSVSNWWNYGQGTMAPFQLTVVMTHFLWHPNWGSCIQSDFIYLAALQLDKMTVTYKLAYAFNKMSNTLYTTPQPFYGPFSRTTRVSRCQKRTSGLYGARED